MQSTITIYGAPTFRPVYVDNSWTIASNSNSSTASTLHSVNIGRDGIRQCNSRKHFGIPVVYTGERCVRYSEQWTTSTPHSTSQLPNWSDVRQVVVDNILAPPLLTKEFYAGSSNITKTDSNLSGNSFNVTDT
ncbi:hypothetical protein V7S43_012964 [Phytophthora oleae]|uniref:Pectate lyase n=1 Tax=Phytophthora oleae TaxID=2107226 RepID=A0ABD3FAW5_9STRA